MSGTSMHSLEFSRASASPRTTDMCAIMPILACAFATMAEPLLGLASGPWTLGSMREGSVLNRIFWPAMAAISLVLVAQKISRFGRPVFPPHIICLLAYLAFAGASVLWAFRPEYSFPRYAQQVMVLTSIVLPAMVATRTADIMRGVFLCFAFGAILNVFFVLNNTDASIKLLNGFSGYFWGKNTLGQFAGAALILSLHEALHPGRRRALGIIILIITVALLHLANSKTALALALLVPCLAGLTLIARKFTRISPAVLLMSIPFCYIVLSYLFGLNINRMSYLVYGDHTLTGRTIIWDFASLKIAQHPFLGWGYQSFWLVGLDAPSVVDAPGWVKTMPSGHSGYYDTMLELGYVGLALLLVFIFTTLHAIGRVAARDTARAWLLLSLALYVIFFNFLESLWMRGFDFLWVVFVIVAAEAARYWQPAPPTRATHGSRTPRLDAPSPSRVVRRHPVSTARRQNAPR